MVAAILLAFLVAIAGPSFLRARRSPGEVRDIGDVRTVLSAESAYQAANGGYFDTLGCLASPVRCLPGYAESAPTFLDARLASETTIAGARRTFHAGPPAPSVEIAKGRLSPTSLEAFAYVSVSATRGVCGDSSGRICVTGGGMEPRVIAGACDFASCRPLQ